VIHRAPGARRCPTGELCVRDRLASPSCTSARYEYEMPYASIAPSMRQRQAAARARRPTAAVRRHPRAVEPDARVCC